VPILLLPASAPRNRAGVHPTFSPNRTYESVVKWSGRVDLPEEIPNALRRAFSQLRLGRPSPVLLELPSDILRGELPSGIADGLGRVILNFNQYYATGPEKLWASILFASLTGMLFFIVITLLERVVVHKQPSES